MLGVMNINTNKDISKNRFDYGALRKGMECLVKIIAGHEKILLAHQEDEENFRNELIQLQYDISNLKK